MAFSHKYQFNTVGAAIAQLVQWLMLDEQSRKLSSTPGRVKIRFPLPELPCRLWSLLNLQLKGCRGLSVRGKGGRSLKSTSHFHLLSKLRMTVYCLLPAYAVLTIFTSPDPLFPISGRQIHKRPVTVVLLVGNLLCKASSNAVFHLLPK